MALFGKKKTDDQKIEATKQDKKLEAGQKAVKVAKEKKPKAEKISATPAVVGGPTSFSSDVIIRPRITEKSGMLSQSGVYTFEVTKNANKVMIASAVKSAFKVTPLKIAIVNLPARKVFVRGRRGVVSGTRKALVTLKKGDKIDFV